VEEVVRLEGYDTVPPELPVAPAGRGLTDAQRLRRAVSRALAATGYVEVLTSAWIGAAALGALGLPSEDERRRAPELANPLSAAEPLLRTTLLPGLLDAVRRNAGRGAPDVALFEIGQVFLARPAAGAVTPPGVSGPPYPGAARGSGRAAARPAAAGRGGAGGQPRAGGLVGAGPAGRVGGRRSRSAHRRRRRRAAPCRGAERAGPVPPRPLRRPVPGRQDRRVAGELHPRVVAALGLPPRTCAMELDLRTVLAAAGGIAPAPRVSPYPPASLDVALVVDATVPAATVESALREGAGDLLESVRLFDVYSGPQVGQGRRSLAYTLVFRAPDRTLTAAETTALRDSAVAAAVRTAGAVCEGPPPAPSCLAAVGSRRRRPHDVACPCTVVHDESPWGSRRQWQGRAATRGASSYACCSGTPTSRSAPSPPGATPVRP
jgi:phenylalanyl-tRNA synthetase beta chain